MLDQLEALFGGAAGGGKSDALLMGALQYVDVPGYSALILRRTFEDLKLPDALMARSHEWLDNTDAHWDEQGKTWTFPSGARLTFGYLTGPRDEYRYQSAAFQYIAWDELTQFKEAPYRYLFSRLRRLEGSSVPIRMRGATNPGNIGHEWVKARFVSIDDDDLERQDRVFVPAYLEDNPYLDKTTYEMSLSRLDPVRHSQLRSGNWEVGYSAGMFKREWFEIVDNEPPASKYLRFWDLAATEAQEGTDPDYTVGCKIAEKAGVFYIADIRRDRLNPGAVASLIKQTAELDGMIPIRMEQEPGSSGKNTIDHYAREILKGFDFKGVQATGNKVVRAQPVSAAAYNHNMRLVRGRWNDSFLQELELFPEGGHDDQVDALSGAFLALKGSNNSRFAVMHTGRVRG